MKKFLTIILLLVSVSIIVGLRFFRLGELPMGTNIDEVSIGVEAKSIVETGKDTWGEKYPTAFKAFGEYKAPGIIYSVAFFVKQFGLSEYSTRLPSAIGGILSMIILYFILSKISSTVPSYGRIIFVLLLSLSPWAFGISRQFFEANAGLPFLLLGILGSLTNSPRLKIALMGIGYGIAGYYYMSYRYLGVIFIFISIILDHSNIKAKIKLFIATVLVMLIVGIGWVSDYASEKSLRRLTQFNSYTKLGSGLIVDENRQYCYLVSDKNPTLSKICYVFWNKPVVKLSQYSATYFDSLSPTVLFIESGNHGTIPIRYGSYLWTLLPLYVLGWYQVIATWIKNNGNQSIRMLSLFLIVAPIPQALTTEVTLHRNLVGIFLVIPIIYLGLDMLLSRLKNIKYLGSIIILGYLALNVFYHSQYLINYFTVFTHSEDIKWAADKKEIWSFLNNPEYQSHTIVDTKGIGPMDAAFYNRITPKEVQSGVRQDPIAGGWEHLESAGQVRLGDVGEIYGYLCSRHLSEKNINTVFITDPISEYSKYSVHQTYSYTKIHVLHEIYDIDYLYEQLKSNEKTKFKDCK